MSPWQGRAELQGALADSASSGLSVWPRVGGWGNSYSGNPEWTPV